MVFTAQLGRENQVGYLRVRSHSMKFRFFSLTIFIYLFIMMGFSSLTIICSSAVFTDKRHTAPRLSLVNVNDLNRVLRFEVFVSEDRQLRAVHLIQDFLPISDIFQDMCHAIRAGDSRLHRILFLFSNFLPVKTWCRLGFLLSPFSLQQ